VAFEQGRDHLVMRGLPAQNPDRIAECAVLKLELESRPRQVLGAGCVVL
jgi:hypothetical protein